MKNKSHQFQSDNGSFKARGKNPFNRKKSNFEIAALFHHVRRVKSAAISKVDFFTIEWSCTSIGHGNRNHATSSNRWRLERFTTSDWDRLLNKALQAPSFGGGCVSPITVPYLKRNPP